jgi:hypothetical protein
MLYGVGSDLESDDGCMTFNLKQIMRAKYNENVDFIVMTGGASKWRLESEYLSGAEAIGTKYNQIWRVTGKKDNEAHGIMTLLEENGIAGYEDTAMSEPVMLTAFIDYCYENYPSDNYDVILWDHGGGPVHGFGNDIRGGFLSLHELYDAFSACKLIKDGKKFEIMDFDACLMANAEVITVLGGFTEQFVGSAETEPGAGQEYFSWLTTLLLEPYIDGATLASYIVESTLLYYNYNNGDYVEDVTLAAIDTKEFYDKILPGLIEIEDILISEAKTKSGKNGRYNFYDELYSLEGAFSYDYGESSLFDLGNLLCALSVTQTEFDNTEDEETETLSNAYTDAVLRLTQALSDESFMFSKTTKDLKKASYIDCTRDMDGKLVWPDTDTVDIFPTCISIFFGTRTFGETVRYINEANEIITRLPNGDAKDFILKNSVSAAYYTLISSLGYYTSMLADRGEKDLDYNAVMDFIRMIFSKNVYEPLLSALVAADEFESYDDADGYLAAVSEQQISELIYKDNVTVKQIRLDGEPMGQYQIRVSDTTPQAMKNVYSSVTATSTVSDREDFADMLEIIYGEPVGDRVKYMYPYGIYVNVTSAHGGVKIAEYIDDYNDTDAEVKHRIYSSDFSVRTLDDANEKILAMYDKDGGAHLCDVYYLDGAKQKALVPVMLYSDLFGEAFLSYLIISYKTDGWSIDGLTFSDDDVSDRSYLPLDNEMFFGYSYAPCTLSDDHWNFITTYVPLCGFMPVDWEADDWGISFGYESVSDLPDVDDYEYEYYIENVYGGYTDITDLFEKADTAAENGDYVRMIITAEVEMEDVVFNGRQQRPSAKITYDGNALTEGVDYKMIYDDRTAPDMYSALALGIGDYHGIVFGTYFIDPFEYEHDPMENKSAAADIVRDDNAIYGYRPSEDGSLKMYADYDWTDPDLVESARQERIAYHQSIESMYEMLEKMKAEGKTVEEIARALSTERNMIRLNVYKDKPDELEQLKQRNLEKYGHEEGPLPDELYEKYGSWELVAEKAFSPNPGMDACLGLYDEYYSVYQSIYGLFDEPETDPVSPPTSDAYIAPCVIIMTLALAISLILIKKKAKA